MRIFLLRILDIISNCKWDLIFYFKLIFQREFRVIMNNNKKLKNSHLNERCFVVGNGPSLNKLDLTKISNEVVFTVNEIMKNKSVYETLNTDFHVLIDPSYSNLSPDLPDELATIDLLKQINYKNKKPVCIVSYKARTAFKIYGVDKLLEINYIYQHKNLTETFSSEVNMCRNMPSSQNVIQAAILSAIYMGFKEIILIGCDMTSVFLTFVSNDEGEKEISANFHAYSYSESDTNTIIKGSQIHDNEYMLYDYAKTFTIFKRIRRYSERKGIKIINATVGGGLDVFARRRFESFFN
jgi:hypothetical protein